MAHLGYDKNKYGTKISKHTCNECGNFYTICPAVEEKSGGFPVCQIKPCPSYSVNTDIDLLFKSDKELSREEIVPIDIKARKASICRVPVNEQSENDV